MVFHETFVEANGIITTCRDRLYDALDMVDAYAKEPSDRKILEELTIKLHQISQDTDSLITSAEMAAMITASMRTAYDRVEPMMQANVGPSCAASAMRSSINDLQCSAEAQKRWLISLKSRKDTAMNLVSKAIFLEGTKELILREMQVFNLVTQQDSSTNTSIARDAKADSSSMKTIATLTMIFLPGTFMSSVFSMDQSKWHLYVALTLPLTCFLIGLWYSWTVSTSLRERWSSSRLNGSLLNIKARLRMTIGEKQHQGSQDSNSGLISPQSMA
ncbi:MAG: hypothetical protein M1822_004599 [Bathelium mastoideum]|nr:MAG: hypothetical protein M1822_004599 [Bathelium mastoideum]